MNLSISFKLTGTGWAEWEIFVDEKVYVITASYLEDALGNLADATLRIAQGEEFAYAVFAEEPGEYEWKIQRINEKVISIEILGVTDWKGLRQSDEKGKTILKFESSLILFVRRVIICLSDVLNKYGLEGYKEKWVEHEFPLKVYTDLRITLQKLKQK